MERRDRKMPRERFVLFPDYEPKRNDAGAISGALYYLSNLGIVHRVDSSVDYDPKNPTFDIVIKPVVRGTTINVKLAGGSVTRSLPAAVAAAYATNSCPLEDTHGHWVAIIHPKAPKTNGVPRCSVIDIHWTPYSESTFWARNQREPKPELMIAIV